MPRDLADVLHHFIPESDSPGPSRSAAPRRGQHRRPTLPIIAVPVGDRDVVRAAFTWNLAVEVARLGGWAAVVAPASDGASALWPEEGNGVLGADVVLAPATNLGQLYRAAQDVAASAPDGICEGGLVFVRIPPLWLRSPKGATGLLAWSLLLTSSDRRDLLESYGIAKLLRRGSPEARVGVTVHGVSQVGEAEEAFSRLAEVAARRLGLDVASYGILVDDLHVYRAIVAQRPIGRVHPQAPAARSLGDVARLLLQDAQSPDPALDA